MDTVRLPGFIDVHVHFREPGFSQKETIRSGSLAAAAGGYIAVCPMPNLFPVPDCFENLKPELDIIRRDAVIKVLPYGSVTAGEKGLELSDMESLAPYVVAFSDDGVGVQSDDMMLRAMRTAKELGKIIAAHCEVNALLNGGKINDCGYARKHCIPVITNEVEYRQIERDLDLAAKTGCAYHVCHISTRQSAEAIRQAKATGVNVTCETAPHYLLLDDSMLRDDGAFRMNPPIRSLCDREALLDALRDGTVDMIATDHAPHTAEEKSKGIAGSLNGITGLEAAFPVLYTGLVRSGFITLERLMNMMSCNPSERFGISVAAEDYTEFDLEEEYIIDPGSFLSMGRCTPFAGQRVYGRCLKTVYGGKTVYEYEKH
ncbi:MAG: dihydroorotase [Clostridia bacterium]|nr:dihydroorotase [Clostridia bacterium]